MQGVMWCGLALLPLLVVSRWQAGWLVGGGGLPPVAAGMVGLQAEEEVGLSAGTGREELQVEACCESDVCVAN
jgi:hypothetical protein